MGRVLMMSIMSSTHSLMVLALGWTHIHLSGIFYDFLELLEAHDFLREAIFVVKNINIFFIVPWGDPRGFI